MAHPTTTILPHPELASVLSKGDVAALSELSNASQVRAWTLRKVENLKHETEALLAIHNSVAPINQLPPEVLQEVFAYVPCRADWCDSSWMLFLQSVCRRWRSVLLATPEYWLRGLYAALDPWNHIAYRDGDDEEDSSSDEDEDKDTDKGKDVRRDRRRYVVDLFLDRSAPLPLEMRVWCTFSVLPTGWKTFEDRFDRVTAFSVEVDDGDDFCEAFHAVVPTMKRLESLELCMRYESPTYGEEVFTLNQWKPEDLPRLGRLRTDAHLFCRAMTVPSLHTITLYGSRDIETLPGLLDALEGCPALTSLYVHPCTDGEQGEQTLDRIVDLPNLRSLELLGLIPALYSFLACVSFPWTTKIDVTIDGSIGPNEFVLPSILPRRISGLHTCPTIDRLWIHSPHRPYHADPLQPQVSMIGFVQGVERLRVGPAFKLCGASHFLQFLEAFAACTVTALALDLGSLPGDLDGAFWRRFFAALPDVRRLELLPRTTRSRATKRAIAEPFLASARLVQEAGHVRETALAWVLYAGTGTGSTPHVGEELGDIEQVLLDHARQGGRLDVLELYIATSGPEYVYWSFSDTTRGTIDGVASRYVTRDYVSRLEDIVDVVVLNTEE